MEYQVLTFDLPDALYQRLKQKLSESGGMITAVFSLRDALQRCEQQTFHMAVLKPIEPGICRDFVDALRRINSMPIVILLDSFYADVVCPMLIGGADLCVPSDWPPNILTEHIMATFRRYTKYNHYSVLTGPAPFQEGDIWIDPARHVVEVSGRPVNLRHWEFSLLLYFMRNPNIVLTAGQICENAWGMEYTQPIDRAIHELRKQIEPNPHQPCYIQTVYRVGYRFTAYSSETCG